MSNDTTVEEFREAVRNDEYAEIKVLDNCYLVTDWEGDGSYHPYVVAKEPPMKRVSDEVLRDQLACEIARMFDVCVHHIENDQNPHTFHVNMERPTSGNDSGVAHPSSARSYI